MLCVNVQLTSVRFLKRRSPNRNISPGISAAIQRKDHMGALSAVRCIQEGIFTPLKIGGF
jgi:hypothetical protein